MCLMHRPVKMCSARTMAKIERIEIQMVDLAPKVRRTDAIQSFESQETPIVKITDSDGAVGIGYSYTIGQGGPAIMSLLHKTLLPKLIGRDPSNIEAIWRESLFATHATSVGAITSLSLAAIDTALWDLRCKKAGLPLYKMAGGAKDRIQLYSTEGGWLHLTPEQLAEDALARQSDGFKGSKIKIGHKLGADDQARLSAVRNAVGDRFEIMTDANQSFSLSEARRRARMLEEFNVAWFEEPLHADDVGAHENLAASTTVPIAVGESMYSLSQFNEYLRRDAASIVQVDVARIGGITPWLKVAHMAEAYNVAVCPHFLMELHVSLCCAVPNSNWLEYIPQLDQLTHSKMKIEDGHGVPTSEPGLGIDWDMDAIKSRSVDGLSAVIT
ncbi:L-alanine-DL-glutamate epimerase-like enolase superfamily enzyme [Maritalea mobilis]|uniref:L-alanine-DL-glutamate epimerase-like enolase superfamily enzyme n=2 Tax=Maritalea mobilis TaxID=483324 RepID=A0A4R6VLI8_9HYPH|nr:L-alanine-DL-glutamate epimerase-like enolase superfamily enzyme [Maritalea mobilis]